MSFIESLNLESAYFLRISIGIMGKNMTLICSEKNYLIYIDKFYIHIFYRFCGIFSRYFLKISTSMGKDVTLISFEMPVNLSR